MNAAALKPISAERMGTIAPGKFKPADTPSLFDIVEAAEGAEVAAEFRRGYLSGAETERLFDEVAAAVAAGTYASATRVPSAAQFCGDEWESELSATVTPIRPKPEDKPKPLPALSQHIGDILAHPTTVRWLKRDEIERGVVAVMSGPRGSCKTASARRWVMHVAAVLGEPVLIFNGEGTGIDRQINGEIKRHYPHIDPATLPIYVVNKRMDLNGEKGRQAANAELTRIQTETGKRPALCVIDTFSKFHFGLQEKDNAAVSLFISGIDAAIRRAFDCTVLIVTHTGYADQTRARGASALEADTDSAYVVSKDPAGIVRVSRERFKDSAELPPLTFKPEIIDLGYKDAVGVAVTTISLAPTTECPKSCRRFVIPWTLMT
jgi:hypothetical protein